MASDNKDSADLFAIPDFWRSSGRLNETLTELGGRNPLFALDVSGMLYSHSCLNRIRQTESVHG